MGCARGVRAWFYSRKSPAKIGPVTFDDHVDYTDPAVGELLLELRKNIQDLDDQLDENVTAAQRIVYKIPGDNIFLEIKVHRSAFSLRFVDAGVSDPKKIAEPIPEKHGWSQLKWNIRIKNRDDLEQAMPFIMGAYQSRATVMK